MWIAQEAWMLEYYCKVAKGSNVRIPDKQDEINVNTIGYIDDNNLLLNAQNEQSVEEWNDIVSNALSNWNKALVISGGQLASEKFCYHATQWIWKNVVPTMHDMDMTINSIVKKNTKPYVLRR